MDGSRLLQGRKYSTFKKETPERTALTHSSSSSSLSVSLHCGFKLREHLATGRVSTSTSSAKWQTWSHQTKWLISSFVATVVLFQEEGHNYTEWVLASGHNYWCCNSVLFGLLEQWKALSTPQQPICSRFTTTLHWENTVDCNTETICSLSGEMYKNRSRNKRESLKLPILNVFCPELYSNNIFGFGFECFFSENSKILFLLLVHLKNTFGAFERWHWLFSVITNFK